MIELFETFTGSKNFPFRFFQLDILQPKVLQSRQCACVTLAKTTETMHF